MPTKTRKPKAKKPSADRSWKRDRQRVGRPPKGEEMHKETPFRTFMDKNKLTSRAVIDAMKDVGHVVSQSWIYKLRYGEGAPSRPLAIALEKYAADVGGKLPVDSWPPPSRKSS